MNRSVLASFLLALAITACGQRDDVEREYTSPLPISNVPVEASATVASVTEHSGSQGNYQRVQLKSYVKYDFGPSYVFEFRTADGIRCLLGSRMSSITCDFARAGDKAPEQPPIAVEY